MSTRSKVMTMLKSSDIEMVKLGAVLLAQFPRKEWPVVLRACTNSEMWYFTIASNKISIHEREVISSFTGFSTGGIGNISTNISTTPLTSASIVWTQGYDPVPMSRDYDEEREQGRILESYQQQIKQKQIYNGKEKINKHSVPRARKHATPSRRP